MSNIFGSLYIGVSGLMTSQAGIDVTGHNIANANTEGYSRQRVAIETQNPLLTTPGAFGRGAKLVGVERVYSNTVANNLRNETSSLNYWSNINTSLDEVNLYFNELEAGTGLGDALKDYFNAWQNLANIPADNSDEAQVKRIELISNAEILADKIQENYYHIEDMQNRSNLNIVNYIDEINDIVENIGALNAEIAKIEAAGNNANDFRDKRDLLLNKLSEYVDFTSSERPDGQIGVFVGGVTLVDSEVVNRLYAVNNEENNNYIDIYWGPKGVDEPEVNITSKISSGKLAAEVKSRDEILPGYLASLSTLAVALIQETNRIHATGIGLERFNSITSTNSVLNPTLSFSKDEGKFPYDITSGTFRIALYNSENEIVEYFDIDIDPEEDNLNSVIRKINEAGQGKLTAGLSSGNSIKITADGGYTFSFVEDTSNFLVAAGLNGFFKGKDASDIAVNELVKNNTNYIASGKSTAPGDNRNLLDIANIKFKKVINDSYTIDEFYSIFASTIAADKSQANTFYNAKKQSADQFAVKLEEIKGVSIDEEFVNLIKFQKAYEANARFITAVDEMIDRLVNGVGIVGR